MNGVIEKGTMIYDLNVRVYYQASIINNTQNYTMHTKHNVTVTICKNKNLTIMKTHKKVNISKNTHFSVRVTLTNLF